MSVTATTDAAKLTVLLHNCCLHTGISIILNLKVWAPSENYWVNWTVLLCSKTQNRQMNQYQKAKDKKSKTKYYYLCIYIVCVMKESLQSNSLLLKINQLKCKNKITGTD